MKQKTNYVFRAPTLTTLFAIATAVIIAPIRSSDADEATAHALLAGRCLECHSGNDPRGGLNLSSRDGLANGSDSGLIFDRDSWESSLLLNVIESGEMPPKGKLTEAEKKTLRDWIQSGATLPEVPIDRFKITSPYRAGYDWWALRPLLDPNPVPNRTGNVEDRDIRDPMDLFVNQRLSEHQLSANPPATPRSLVRRIYLDLIGLPPSFEEVAAFERDPSDDAYLAIVDRLLRSPAYGERWARHWLDVVRFGESDGFERNFPRQSSWHYRDWVIDALNRDLPYDQFVRMQIAGDLIEPNESGYSAVSFLVSGVHNTVVGSSDRMIRIAKQDELEEKIGTLSQTFLGLTAQCARCHEHKFDPISSESYYRLAASLTGVAHGEREVLQDSQHAREQTLEKQRRELLERASSLDQLALALYDSAPNQRRPDQPKNERANVDSQPAASMPLPIAAWNFETANGKTNVDPLVDSVHGIKAQLHGNESRTPRGLFLDGQSYAATETVGFDIAAKTLSAWVTVDPLEQSGGGIISLQTLDGSVFDAIVYGERDAKQWMAGSNGFTRSQSFQAPQEDSPADQRIHIAIRYQTDGTIQAFRNGAPYGTPYRTSAQNFQGKNSQFLFGLRHGPPGGNRFFKGVIHSAACFDSALSDEAISQLGASQSRTWDLKFAWETMSESERAERQELRNALAEIDMELKIVRSQIRKKIYTVISNTNPGPTKLLVRGDVYNEAHEVRPGGIACVGNNPNDFGLGSDASDAERRKSLAEWITSANRALLARVLVNRVWHYHFGSGIVDTPNDFGFNGGRPSHPELLDHLASRFLDGGMKLKDLHRWIVQSSTYRRSSDLNPLNMNKDSSNRWLWRYPVRRLDGESVRDSMLKMAGVLNPQRGGPGYVDVDIRENNGTTYYFPKAPETEDCFRRTVYRFNPRCERSPLLDVLDCPDPSTTAPKRANTTTPLQALSLLNNPFILQMSESIVGQLRPSTDVSQRTDQELVRPLFRTILLRDPDPDEEIYSRELVSKHGAIALARALWNTNEFLVLE
ncbi:MAG: DUF1553 domain-containing protein [Planctomycetes bacterium]|nr:DUF1553 domain-containing protein [Planctomycetota bacterium]